MVICCAPYGAMAFSGRCTRTNPARGRLEERKDEKSLSQPLLQWETRGFEPSLTPCHYFSAFVTGRSPMS